MFYNGCKILSYNNNFNFIIGNRNSGKSFYWKGYILHRFFKTGKKFILVYRYEKDMLAKAPTYFTDITDIKYKDFKIIFKKDKEQNTFYLLNLKNNKKIEIGNAIDLNKGFKKASMSFVNHKTILYDEFITPDGKYIKNKDHPYLEVENFLHFYQTVARGGGSVICDDVKAIFIANAVTLANQFFIYLNIIDDVRFDEEIYNLKNKNVSVELNLNTAITDIIKKSKFYKTIKNTKYNEFANDNKFYLDNKHFIKNISKKYKPLFKFYVDGREYNLLTNKTTYIFSKIKCDDKNVIGTFAITENDFKPNFYKIEYFKKCETYKLIYDLYLNNNLFFDTQESYRIFLFIYSL